MSQKPVFSDHVCIFAVIFSYFRGPIQGGGFCNFVVIFSYFRPWGLCALYEPDGIATQVLKTRQNAPRVWAGMKLPFLASHSLRESLWELLQESGVLSGRLIFIQCWDCAAPNPSPILDKNRAPMRPSISSSTGAGVWRQAPKGISRLQLCTG